jgi:cell division transport system permease protein
MFWLRLKRVLRWGFVSFWRNGFVSLSSVLVMFVTLFVIGSLIFSNALLNDSLQEIREKVDVNVYFNLDAPEDSILDLRSSLERLPEVAFVEYVSREQALQNFRDRHQNDELILQALDELADNPLGAILNIKAKEPSQYEGIANFLQSDSALSVGEESIIDKINYFQNKEAIEKIDDIINSSQKSNLSITIFLVLVSIIVTFNTIRLAIYTAKEEISVMKLVGASNMRVRAPFVIEGVIYGVASGIIVMILFYPITFWLGPIFYPFSFFSNVAIGGSLGGLNLFDYYVDNFASIFSLIMVSGAVIGAISSFLAVRKYLKPQKNEKK